MQPPAGALAERPVVAVRRHRGRVGRRAARPQAVLAVEALAERGVHGRPVGADQRGVGVPRGLSGQLPRVAEDQPVAVEPAAVGRVVARVRHDAREAPRVLRHQLGVRVDEDVHPLRVLLRVGELEPEQRAAVPVGRDVDPLQPDPVDGGELVAHVAGARGELRRLRHPRVVDPEGHRVEQLQRRRDDAAHLPRDVPAVGVEPAVLEPEHLRPGAGRDLAAVLQPLGHRQLRRRGLRRARRQGRQHDAGPHRSSHTHHSTSVRTGSSRSSPYPFRAGMPQTVACSRSGADSERERRRGRLTLTSWARK